MHDQQLLLFGVDHIQLDEVCALIEGCFECLKCIFGEDGAESAMSDVEWPACLVYIGCGIGFRDGSEEESEEEYWSYHADY